MSYYIRYGYTEPDGRQVDGIASVPDEMDAKIAEKLIKEGKASKLVDKATIEEYNKLKDIKEDDWEADEP